MKREFSRTERSLMKWLSMLYDLVVISVGALAMIYVIYLVVLMALDMLSGFHVQEVLQDIVTILIFLEIFEILSMYFLHHHVNMKNVVEIGVLAVVKELLVNIEPQALGWETLLAMAALIFVMGILYVLEMKRINAHNEFLIEHGIEPEKEE